MKRKPGNRKRGKFLARKQRVARGLGVSDRTRLTVYRSARHIYAQLVDPDSGRTVASVSTLSMPTCVPCSMADRAACTPTSGSPVASITMSRLSREVTMPLPMNPAPMRPTLMIPCLFV